MGDVMGFRGRDCWLFRDGVHMSLEGNPNWFVSIILTMVYYSALALGGGFMVGLAFGAAWAGFKLVAW